MRYIPSIDRLIGEVDTVIKTLLPPPKRTSLRNPPANIIDKPLSAAEKKHVAGLMRINHAGEVCAQALYQGQSISARLPDVREQMAHAAEEEVEHLAWCESRLRELGFHPSKLNIFWYSNSFLIGLLAGMISDRVSLGFVAETERQVSAHLQEHIQKLPAQDKRTHAILRQMQEDEEEHEKLARDAGAYEFPKPVRELMSMVAKVMTKTAYYI